ncbi:MAG: hypothetical protein M0009_00115 [Deltaproteobacteria bacterium]|nr:hypothetical protein [Deltaproteobacteria bacterium]
MKRAVKVILFNILAIALLLALFEGTMYLLVHTPALLKHCPKGIRNSIGYLYNVGDRKVIQFTPECAQYDPGLGYTLKPGHCVFSGAEFRNRYDINSLGLRDEEKALRQPEVIVAGDSYAMGWGVDQEETFARVLGKKTGLKVLNAGVASYGTAREMLSLGRLETGRLKYLIVQYCENDFDENREFLNQGNRLKTMSAEEYAGYRALNNEAKGYYPGKYLALKIAKKRNELRKPAAKKEAKEPAKTNRDDVDLFLNALMNGPRDLSQVQIIVFDAVGKGDFDRPFIGKLAERIRGGQYPAYIRNIIPLDITKVITKEQYYVLDDHWRKAGHGAIAEALATIIQKAERSK